MASRKYKLVFRKELGWFLFFLLFLSWFRCSDNGQLQSCSDPLGSENLTITACANLDNFYSCYFCFGSETISGTDTCRYNYCYELYATSVAASRVIRSIYFTNGCNPSNSGSIVDVGLVSCLGQVNYKPSSGYVYTLAPALHHGYVVSFPNGTFGRFFIDSWTQASGVVSKINVTRQYPF